MRVAVIGVGVMGSAIAGRLLDTGAEVHLCDRDPAKVATLVARGAAQTPSPAAAASAADFVITSLNSAAIVEEAVFGPAGIAEAGSPDRLLVDMSSIDAARTAQLARRLAEAAGMGWVDAPLSGGAPAATEGRLTLMLGGSEADVGARHPAAGAAVDQLHAHGCFGCRADGEAGQPDPLRRQLPGGGRGGALRRGARCGCFAHPRRAGRGPRRFAHPPGVHGQDGAARLHADRPYRQHAEGPGDGAGVRARRARGDAGHVADRRPPPDAGGGRARRGGQRRICPPVDLGADRRP